MPPVGTGDAIESKSVATPYSYGGQRVCPVSGDELGAKGPPVAVATNVGARRPNFIGRLFGRKATPGAVIFACSPECAEKARTNPNPYVNSVLAERRGWSNSDGHRTALERMAGR